MNGQSKAVISALLGTDPCFWLLASLVLVFCILIQAGGVPQLQAGPVAGAGKQPVTAMQN